MSVWKSAFLFVGLTVAAVVLGGNFPACSRAADLIAEWRFDDATNFGKDSSGNGWHMVFGTANGSQVTPNVDPAYTRGELKTTTPTGLGTAFYGLRSDGKGEEAGFYADFTKGGTQTAMDMASYTVSFWFNPAAGANSPIQSNGGWGSFNAHNYADQRDFYIGYSVDARFSMPFRLELDQWQYISYTYDYNGAGGANAAVYLNGELKQTANWSGVGAPAWSWFGITQNEWLNGGIDDFTLWSGAMNQNTVARMNAMAKIGNASDILAAPGSLQEAVLNDSPMAYWRFNEGAGATTFFDMTDNGRNMVYVTDGLTVNGAGGKNIRGENAVYLTNENPQDLNKVQLHAAGLGISGDYTVEFWLNPDSFDSQLRVRGDVDNWKTFTMHTADIDGDTANLYIGSDIDNRIAKSTGVLTLDDWNHVVFTLDDAGLYSLFINGELTDTHGGGSTDTFNELFLHGLSGFLSDMAVYNYALTLEQVQNHYLLGGGMGDAAAAPEPATWVMLVLGATGLCLIKRRRDAEK